MQTDNLTIKETMLDVGDGHTIYAQLWGSPDAKDTVLFLHGGPGSGCNDKHKTLFDPTRQRVLFFDQRGAGKSLPKGSLKNNTTQDLVADIEKLAAHFSVDKFIVTGGSWGSTLALVLAIEKSAFVKSLVLRGVFTAREWEIKFMDRGEFKPFFPEVWSRYSGAVPSQFRTNPGSYHMPRILGEDQVAAKESAYEYEILESSIMTLDDRISLESFEAYDKSGITIEVSYLAQSCYLPEGYIFDNAANITVPVYMVQGRYDFVCPPATAYELNKLLPNSTLIMTQAGHSGHDRANWEAVKSILASVAN
jgi:proline iminopeptidase